MTPVWFGGHRADNEPVRLRWCLVPVVAALLAAVMGDSPQHRGAQPPPGAPGCPLFPANNVWHADISGLPSTPRSGAWLANMGGPDRRLHPDFGPSGEAMPYGIPYTVVDGRHPRSRRLRVRGRERSRALPVRPGHADRGRLRPPRPACSTPTAARSTSSTPPITRPAARRRARARSGTCARTPCARRAGRRPTPPGCRSSPACCARRGAAGVVDHAIRFTAPRTDRSYVWPARHQAGAANDPNLPPMGARFRLKASFDISGFRPDTQVVLRAMQRYGMILADNGSNWFFTGTAEDGWDTHMLDELKTIPAGAFDAVDASSLMVDPNSGQVKGAPGATGVRRPRLRLAGRPPCPARPSLPRRRRRRRPCPRQRRRPPSRSPKRSHRVTVRCRHPRPGAMTTTPARGPPLRAGQPGSPLAATARRLRWWPGR